MNERLTKRGKIVELPYEIGEEKFVILPNTNEIVKGIVCAIIYQNDFLIDFGYATDRFGCYSKYTQLLPEELFDTYEEAKSKLSETEGDNDDHRNATEVARNIFGNLRILGYIDFDGNFCIKKNSFEELEKRYTKD